MGLSRWRVKVVGVEMGLVQCALGLIAPYGVFEVGVLRRTKVAK